MCCCWTNFHCKSTSILLGVNDLSLIFAVHLRGVALAEGSVVQLVRMPPCHGGGRGFESRPVRIDALQGLFLNKMHAFFSLASTT